MLNEQEFIRLVEDILTKIQFQAEEWFDLSEELDLDVFRSGNVVTIIFKNATQIVINSQEPKKELWLAAKSGGYHFYYDQTSQRWIDTRTQVDFNSVFLQACREQSGEATLDWTVAL